jgi:hypothetical protein
MIIGVNSYKQSTFLDILFSTLREASEMILSKINIFRLYFAILLSFIVLTALSACSMSNYGKLKSNPEAAQAFEAYQDLPDHKYYYRGTYGKPFVIAGINKNYELDSKLWVEIDPKSKDFRTLINRISLQGAGSTSQPWGFTILDKSGNDVGVWYSAIRAAAVEIDENGRIVNLSPLSTVTVGDQPR